MKNIKVWLRHTNNKCVRRAEDRNSWRSMIADLLLVDDTWRWWWCWPTYTEGASSVFTWDFGLSWHIKSSFGGILEIEKGMVWEDDAVDWSTWPRIENEELFQSRFNIICFRQNIKKTYALERNRCLRYFRNKIIKRVCVRTTSSSIHPISAVWHTNIAAFIKKLLLILIPDKSYKVKKKRNKIRSKNVCRKSSNKFYIVSTKGRKFPQTTWT